MRLGKTRIQILIRKAKQTKKQNINLGVINHQTDTKSETVNSREFLSVCAHGYPQTVTLPTPWEK